MSSLLKFLKSLFARSLSNPICSADEAYLNEAVDIYDLERRMRALDDSRRSARSYLAIGLYPR